MDGAELDSDAELRAALRDAFRSGDVMLNMNVPEQWDGAFAATGLGLLRYEEPRMCRLEQRCAPLPALGGAHLLVCQPSLLSRPRPASPRTRVLTCGVRRKRGTA